MHSVTTLTQFILEEERKHLDSSGSLTLLLTNIEDAVKIIASHVKNSGLVDILGETGGTNVYGEQVQKLDEFSNRMLIEACLSSGQVFAAASEEEEEFVYPKKHTGEYIVFFDPLDGSSIIDTNGVIGTIFSIYKKNESSEDLFYKGSEQVAAGYALYGSSVMFVYTTGNGVNGFTLDPSIGSFLLSHPEMSIPDKKIYSLNEAYYDRFDHGLQKYLDDAKKASYKLRYIGSLVGDVHRTLIQGGIYIYPGDVKNPEGKLRLLFEINPMSMIVEAAGGMATSGGQSPLDITPTALDNRVPIALGTTKQVEKYMKYVKAKG